MFLKILLYAILIPLMFPIVLIGAIIYAFWLMLYGIYLAYDFLFELLFHPEYFR